MDNTQNEVVSALYCYNEARERLAKAFDMDDIWHNVIDLTDEKWYEWSDSVSYGTVEDVEPDEDADIEFDYSFEVYGTSRWEQHGFVLFVGDNGCGDRDMYIFDLKNRVGE